MSENNQIVVSNTVIYHENSINKVIEIMDTLEVSGISNCQRIADMIHILHDEIVDLNDMVNCPTEEDIKS